MDKEIFDEALKDIEKSVAKFAIEFESWLAPIGDVDAIFKVLPKQVTSVGDAILASPDKENAEKFLLLMALYRGYLYGEYFINSSRYKTGATIEFTEHDPKKIMDAVLDGRAEGDNLADRLDLFFHILVSSSKHTSVQVGDKEPENSEVEQYMMMGLMVRFAELKVAVTEGTTSIEFSDVVMLQPNFFGIGVNLNKIIRFIFP